MNSNIQAPCFLGCPSSKIINVTSDIKSKNFEFVCSFVTEALNQLESDYLDLYSKNQVLENLCGLCYDYKKDNSSKGQKDFLREIISTLNSVQRPFTPLSVKNIVFELKHLLPESYSAYQPFLSKIGKEIFFKNIEFLDQAPKIKYLFESQKNLFVKNNYGLIRIDNRYVSMANSFDKLEKFHKKIKLQDKITVQTVYEFTQILVEHRFLYSNFFYFNIKAKKDEDRNAIILYNAEILGRIEILSNYFRFPKENYETIKLIVCGYLEGPIHSPLNFSPDKKITPPFNINFEWIEWPKITEVSKCVEPFFIKLKALKNDLRGVSYQENIRLLEKSLKEDLAKPEKIIKALENHRKHIKTFIRYEIPDIQFEDQLKCDSLIVESDDFLKKDFSILENTSLDGEISTLESYLNEYLNFIENKMKELEIIIKNQISDVLLENKI
jgi:hypothetical protein